MKTMEGWHESKLDLGKFLQIGDVVDEEMADYFLCVLPPACMTGGILQIGEPNSHVNGRATFATIKRTSEGWVYCGNCHRGQTEEPKPESKLEAARAELTAAGIEHTRKDYMAGTVDHQAYYGQFATESVVRMVEMFIGKDAVINSTDPSFNDIPLAKWDALSGYHLATDKARTNIPTAHLVALSNMFMQAPENAVPSISLSDCVSILKAAARKIKETAAAHA